MYISGHRNDLCKEQLLLNTTYETYNKHARTAAARNSRFFQQAPMNMLIFTIALSQHLFLSPVRGGIISVKHIG